MKCDYVCVNIYHICSAAENIRQYINRWREMLPGQRMSESVMRGRRGGGAGGSGESHTESSQALVKVW